MNAAVESLQAQPLRVDLGCGPNKKGPDWVGVDSIKFPAVDMVLNIGSDPWPWPDASIEEAHCSHTLEHLTNLDGKWERVHFFNELYRTLKIGGKCALIIPHWASQRYYGDPTHKEPFSEFGFYYLDRNWRKQNAPHADIEHNPRGYSCHLNVTWGYNLHQSLLVRNSEYQQHAMTFWREACQDMVATITKQS